MDSVGSGVASSNVSGGDGGDEEDNPEEELLFEVPIILDDGRDDDEEDDDHSSHAFPGSSSSMQKMRKLGTCTTNTQAVVPHPDVQWQEDAVMECFQQAIRSHDMIFEKGKEEGLLSFPGWKPPPFFAFSSEKNTATSIDEPKQQREQQDAEDLASSTQIQHDSDRKNEFIDDDDDLKNVRQWKPQEVQLPSWVYSALGTTDKKAA